MPLDEGELQPIQELVVCPPKLHNDDQRRHRWPWYCRGRWLNISLKHSIPNSADCAVKNTALMLETTKKLKKVENVSACSSRCNQEPSCEFYKWKVNHICRKTFTILHWTRTTRKQVVASAIWCESRRLQRRTSGPHQEIVELLRWRWRSFLLTYIGHWISLAKNC